MPQDRPEEYQSKLESSMFEQGRYEECQSIHRPRVYHTHIFCNMFLARLRLFHSYISQGGGEATNFRRNISIGKNNKMAAEVFLSCIVTIGMNNGLAMTGVML